MYRFGLMAFLALGCLNPAHAQNAADFYKGKNVSLAISFSPGGGYDLYARTLARYMGKHLAGNPQIVHHALVFADPTGQSRAKSDANGSYDCFGGPGLTNTSLLAAT